MSGFLQPEQRTILVKFLAYLGLVRWYNLLLIAIAQYFCAVQLFQAGHILSAILNPQLHLIVLSFNLIIAGGYLINAFYDLEKDLANQPQKLIIGRVISKSFALNTYLLFNFLGVLIAFGVSAKIGLFCVLLAFFTWFYSHKVKKLAFAGNLLATSMSISSLFILAIYYHQLPNQIIMYALFMGSIELARSLVKDIESIKGDLLFGYRSIPLILGIKKTKWIIGFLFATTLIPLTYFQQTLLASQAKWVFFVGLCLLLFAMVILYQAKTRKQFEKVNNILKINLILGVISILFS